MKYGQAVLGTPGAGKTTYCAAMDQFLTAINREHIMINLDPAAEIIDKYTPDINIQDLIKAEEVQETLDLGPNGALLYCLDFLYQNIEWLFEKIEKSDADYFIFDTPGQVETYSVDNRLKEILETIKSKLKMEICCVNLTDSHTCTDPTLFISGMLVSLSATVNLEMPFVNFLSKIDLLSQYGELPFPLEFFTDEFEPEKLAEMVTEMGGKFGQKHANLTKKLCEVVENYSLVSYTPLDITDKLSMSNALQLVDKSNGYAYKEFTVGQNVFNMEKYEEANKEILDKIREKDFEKDQENIKENEEN